MDPSPSPASPTPPKRSRAGGLLLFVLVALVLAAAGWYSWRQWHAQQARIESLAVQRRHALDARIDALRVTQQAQTQRLQQAEATNRVLRDELLGIGQRAALLEDSVSKLADPDRHGAQSLRLDEIELLLGIGQQRLQLADDLDGARRALALAAPLLAGIDDPAYLNLRQTLAQEQAAMEALGVDPGVRANALLDTLMEGVQAAPVAPASSPARAPWYQRLLARVVRAQPTASAGLNQRPDREAALTALQVEVTLARAAIERRDGAALIAAATRIEGGLQRLLARSPLLVQKRRIAAELKALPLRAESPLSGTTLQQLRALRGE